MWKDIAWTNGLYSASSCGAIRRNAGFDSIGRRRKETRLKPRFNKKGRGQVNIFMNGIPLTRSVSRLVFEAFNGEIPEGMQVRHKDKNPKNNSIDNLVLLSWSEDKGENNGFSKLCEAEVLDIRSMARDGYASKYIAHRFKIDQSTVRDIITGRTWPHAPLMDDNSKNGTCRTPIN